MTALGVSRKSLERRHRNSIRALLKTARDLPDRPSPDQIHDLRVAVRRIQVMRKLLPKTIREFPDAKRFDLSLKSAMKATSRLRDVDTLMETLAADRRAPAETMINLQNQRSDLAAGAKDAAAQLAQVPVPRIDWAPIRGKKVSKKLRKRAREQGRVATALLEEVVADESKAAELHALRKEVKKLRYLMELADKSSPEVAVLTDWQESLGAIHDLDVAVTYLQGKGPDFAKTVRALLRIRHSRYLGFVRMCVMSSGSLTKSRIRPTTLRSLSP